jgi:hypothetical protein
MHTRNLSPVTRAILLSGPAGILLCTSSLLSCKNYFGFQITQLTLVIFSFFEEFYKEELAKALAHYFESKLLFLDVNYFSSKVVFLHLFTLLALICVIYVIIPFMFSLVQMPAKYRCPTKEPVSVVCSALRTEDTSLFTPY